MGTKLSPIGNGVNWYPTTGLIASGCKLFFYAANTSTKQDTFIASGSTTANPNPITLDSYGRSANTIWLTEGQFYKVVIAPSTDTDPPSSGVTLGDYIAGVNDTGDLTFDQWIPSGLAPTYVSGTSFTLTGDQTSEFHIGRRIKTTNTGGTRYSTITNSVFGAVTTVTVTNDSGNLDSGLSAVYYGVLSSVNPSVPKINLPDGSTGTTQAASDSSTKLATTAYADTAVTNGVSQFRDPGVMDFRLTLTSATPVTTSNVSAATTVYMTPYKGNRIALYDGSTWALYTTAEISVALGTITSDQGYDVFCYSNAGTPTLEILAWTNNTTRATALAYQNGALVKSGATTRRYIGSFLTTSTTTTEDSDSKRYLFNYYNKVVRELHVFGSSTWTYSTQTWRQANASTANQINVFCGVSEDAMSVNLVAHAKNTVGNTKCYSSVGWDSTSSTAFSLTCGMTSATTNDEYGMTLSAAIIVPEGKHYAAWLEYGAGTGGGNATTWTGAAGQIQSGISGIWRC